MSAADRSISRGREALQSTGRGGFGNIRQASVSRDRSASANPLGGPDDFSTTRGRSASLLCMGTSTGRGGAGNLRSPSREPRSGVDVQFEKEVIDAYTHNRDDAPVSTGRGGLGNIAARSRSRDPSVVNENERLTRPPSYRRPPDVSRPQGAPCDWPWRWGNIREGDGYDANAADEVERGSLGAWVWGEALPHSTGRGGIANITEQEEPALERPSLARSLDECNMYCGLTGETFCVNANERLTAAVRDVFGGSFQSQTGAPQGERWTKREWMGRRGFGSIQLDFGDKVQAPYLPSEYSNRKRALTVRALTVMGLRFKDSGIGSKRGRRAKPTKPRDRRALIRGSGPLIRD
ncbi:hypothetical protein FA13DRAFT_1779709 [Coprinellus micaceus]|uniref:Uncharacterized protein n=1 Tax=Coprinellus micaceus TaxID=71717 RepID=A0A4Y7SFW3_COPMI|nr:hypothetical protein FA13DRAFT_1779709 [Coprinellus micaceus]